MVIRLKIWFTGYTTVKILKIRTPQKIAVIILKLEQDRFTADELAQKM